MSFTVKKILQLVLLATLFATSLTFAYLHMRCDYLSKDITAALDRHFTKLTKQVIDLPENQTDKKNMEDLVTLVLSSRSLRSVAYIQHDNYLYSDRNADLNSTISPSLQQRLHTAKLPFLYRKPSSLNKIDELHLVIKGESGIYQLFINARYMDDWLTNADEYLRGYVVGSDNSVIINKKRTFLYYRAYHSTTFPFTVVVGAKASQIVFSIGALSAVILLFAIMVFMIANYIHTNNFSFRKEVENGLRHNEFVPYYQPIICNKTHAIVGAELLCRWYYRHKTLRAPGQFITKVENNGQIKAITLHLLQQLAKDKAELANADPNFYISINVTLSMLSDPSFVNEATYLIQQTPALQQGLVFEMTERENTTEAFIKLDKIMQLFREIGVRWALDDYGTGYSSLSSIKELNFDIIKIDRLFVNSADTDAVTNSILQNIALLGKELKCKLVAEGVENQAQLKKLTSLHIDYTQGFYFSKPLDKNAFVAFRTQHTSTSPATTSASVLLKYHGPKAKP